MTTLEFSHDDLWELRLALSDYSCKWLMNWMDIQAGKQSSISAEGARLCYNKAHALHQEIVSLMDNM